LIGSREAARTALETNKVLGLDGSAILARYSGGTVGDESFFIKTLVGFVYVDNTNTAVTIFDVDEAKDIHNNAVAMLQRAIGVDVLTTFADVESIDMADKTTTTATDELERVERAVYNASGTSKNIFNTDGNIALEKSILEDESTIRDLLLQFTIFFDRIVQGRNSNRRKYAFRFYMLETTQYNY